MVEPVTSARMLPPKPVTRLPAPCAEVAKGVPISKVVTVSVNWLRMGSIVNVMFWARAMPVVSSTAIMAVLMGRILIGVVSFGLFFKIYSALIHELFRFSSGGYRKPRRFSSGA